MSRPKSKSMSDFLVTFFVDNRAFSQLLSDVLKNKHQAVFNETLGLPSDFIIPFSQEENRGSVIYTIKANLCGDYDITLNGQPCSSCVIHSGDYFSFTHKDKRKAVKALLIATSEIQAGYKKYQVSKDTNIFIGRTPINDISYDFTDFISREKHAAIHIDSNGTAFIEDLKRSVGVYVNGQLTHSQQLKPFDEIFVMGLSIIYMGGFIAVRDLKTESSLSVMPFFDAKMPIADDKSKQYFVNTPRILKSLDSGEIEVDAPPSPFSADETPVILTLGPSLTMSLVMLASIGVSITNAISGGELSSLIASGTMAGGMLLGSLLWPSLLRSYQKRRTLAEEKHRKSRYSAYIADVEKTLITKRDRNVRVLNDYLSPSPEVLCSFLDNENNRLRLWERSFEEEDFLSIRMGLGNRPFSVQLKIPKQGFQLHEDELRNLPVELAEKYSVLNNVPLTLDMRSNRAIGIIGSQQNIRTILYETILDIISLHPYDEVKLVIVASPKQAAFFEEFRNVPHIWSNDKKVRFFATTPDEVHYVFNIIDNVIKAEGNLQDKNEPAPPHYVVIVTEPYLIENEALLRYMNDADNQVGITTLFAYGNITRIPKSCNAIIQSDDTRTGYYIKNKNANRFTPFALDKIEPERICAFANELSRLPIKRDSRSLGIADRISFLQMYKAGNIQELDIEYHWDNNNSAKSLAAPIGVMAGGDVFSLDIHESYHGCHGLVAGTTGSGKSEFLQAFILSLAINYSPKEVSFVLVDFKGGDMARPFMAKPTAPALPHLSATISNLSGNILYRALVSLEAEIKSRQRIFNESAAILGVDKLDINSYHKYYKGGRLNTPLPHMVIIIDEFAQLKTQQPEFLAQLINVAQVGRSLGIHLILATQKPSGVVDPQIMSNSRFKVCLKVADKQDSIDMINKPDAAFIKNPGRLYLQVGYDEIYEYVQSGYSGADYIPAKTYIPDEEVTVHMTDNTANPIHSAKIDLSGTKSDKTQLEAVVAEIVSLGQKKCIAAKPLWLDVLPEKVVLGTLKRGNKGLCSATVGLVDFVRTQEQKPLTIDFTKAGHIALYGASGTGKTTFLQTLVYSMVHEYGYTPEELNIYAMDFGGRNLGHLSLLPHTGGVVFADEENKVSELASVLKGIIDERKRLFADNNCSTFVDFHAISKMPLPAVLVLIDNFASFRDKYMDIADSFIELISSGSTVGVYFIITGSTKNSIYYKVTEQISTYFTLRMNDPSNYLDIHNIRPPVVPENISGRGITVINKEIVEFQTALALDSENEAERTAVIIQNYSDLAACWQGYTPIPLSSSVDCSYASPISSSEYSAVTVNNTPDPISEGKESLVLGTSKSGALLYGTSLSDDYKVCICANGSEELNPFYQSVLTNLSLYSDRQIVFIDGEGGTFESISNEFSSCRYINDVKALDLFIDELKPQLNARLEDYSEPHQQIFIIISEFNSFFSMITDEQAAFMRKVLRYINTPQYQIYFVCGYDVVKEKSNDSLFMSLVVNAENYILCPNSYEAASAKIETLPLISKVKPQGCYFCHKEQHVEIRW